MSQIRRQSELFAAEDWTVIYRAFSDINFNAFDFNTIRQSMVDYIRFNFPEDFNDWIESSEFVALIDLMAYLGQSLAFRMDLNTRENFIDTAERKESLLRMGRMLSYQPTRNIAANGLLKVVAISTSERLVDSLGQNLQNVNIIWDDANNLDFFEQWTLIINSAFQTTNPFGQPVKNGTVNNIPTDLYAFNTDPVNVGQYPFASSTNQGEFNFEIVNVDFDETIGFTERTPRPDHSSHIIYRNDGNGNSSSNTGFFMYFKQGTLNFRDFNLSIPIENRVININSSDINNFDVFVQTIDEVGSPTLEWTQVPAIVGNNVIFNALVNNINDIYSVLTRDDDQISLRFGDGVFGNVPTGTLRTYFRTSANEIFDIKPSNMRGVQIAIPYFNARGESHSLTLTMNLQNTVANSSTSETIEQIRERAPQVFYTQNRMVNGEDYNVFPLQDTRILKLKALNRTYSGHSRFIDLNDPTSTSQSVKVIADDGLFYKEDNDFFTEIPLSANKTAAEIITETVNTSLLNREIQQFYYEIFPYVDATETPDLSNPRVIDGNDLQIEWTQASDLAFSSTGFFNVSGNTNAIEIGPIATTVDTTREYLNQGAIVEFEDPNTQVRQWVAIQSVTDNGSINGGDGIFASGKGRVTIAEPIITGSKVITVFPSFRSTLILSEINAVRSEIENEETFGLRFDAVNQSWEVITAANIAPVSSPFSAEFAGDVTLQNVDSSWLFRMDFAGDKWDVRARGIRFIWESVRDVRFFINQFRKVQGTISGRVSNDTITIPDTFQKPSLVQDLGLGEELKMAVTDTFIYPDGFQEPRRVIVSYTDLDEDGIPDDPRVFAKAVELNAPTTPLVFHEILTNPDQTETEFPLFDIVAVSGINTTDPLPDAGDQSKIVIGTVVYNQEDGIFYEFQGGDNKTILGNYTVTERILVARTGRSGFRFIWRHIADRERRVDPAITNIIDLYTLTEGYDIEFRRFIAGTAPVGPNNPAPLSPTSEQLRRDFNVFDTSKMVSDTLVWRPAEYVALFGDRARDEVRAKIKVVRVQGTDVSDGELRTQVIDAINEFFDVDRWDFGDTFYASELQAFIHLRNATSVGGVEIVPLNEESRFGQLEEIRLETNQLFISAARVTDVDIVENFNKSTLRIGD